jgi:hypothetical protein
MNFRERAMTAVAILLAYVALSAGPGMVEQASAQDIVNSYSRTIGALQQQLDAKLRSIAALEHKVQGAEAGIRRCRRSYKQSCENLEGTLANLQEQLTNEQRERDVIVAQIREARRNVTVEKQSIKDRLGPDATAQRQFKGAAERESIHLPGQVSFYLAPNESKMVIVQVPCGEAKRGFTDVRFKVEAGGPMLVAVSSKGFNSSEGFNGKYEKVFARCILGLCGCRADYSDTNQTVRITVSNNQDKKYNSVVVSADWE